MPLSIQLDEEVVDGINDAITAGIRNNREVGGILLGIVDYPPGRPPCIFIGAFEAVALQHRRGSSYTLSERDRKSLGKKLSGLNAHAARGLRPVGYFRSHMRQGLYLDNEDFAAARDYFPELNSAFLLIRPDADGSRTGGFFFWENGDMHRESSHLEFPFDRARLPLTPVDRVLPETPPPEPPVAPQPAVTGNRWNWAQLVVPATMALLLLIATFKAHTIPPPAPPPAQPPAAQPAAAIQQNPNPAPAAPVERPSALMSQPKPRTVRNAKQRAAATGEPTDHVPDAAPSPAEADSQPAAASHENPPALAATRPAPAPAESAAVSPPPAAAPSTPARAATFTVEPVESSSLKHAVTRIPGLRRFDRDTGFVPARPIHIISPALPPGAAAPAHDMPVEAKVKVDETGHVRRIEVKNADRRLAESVADAAEQWRFEPARWHDKAVTSQMLLHFTFKPAGKAQP